MHRLWQLRRRWKRALPGSVRTERGATMVLVAIAMSALLGFLALVIDLGMLFVAHSDAQRAADAAALAGASAFLNSSNSAADMPARQRALEYAQRNTFRNGPIDSADVAITVLTDSAKVGVFIHRDSVRTFFAGILGIRTVPVSAFAAAEAVPAGAAKCLKPFAVPDLWYDPNGDTNGNHVPDTGETWVYGDNPADRYQAYSGPGGSPLETGYGSSFRNAGSNYSNDLGRQITIKFTDPNSKNLSPTPGIFLPWQIPTDGSQGTGNCTKNAGGNGSVYYQNICSCNNSSVQLGKPYSVLTGDKTGPTAQGVSDLIKSDPNALWDNSTQSVAGSSYGNNWMSSPRVVKIALFAPGQITKSGMQTLTFNNYALFFLESQNKPQDPVTGRFLYYVSGSGDPGTTTGSLVKTLRLVK